jgi:hypothetical protein
MTAAPATIHSAVPARAGSAARAAQTCPCCGQAAQVLPLVDAVLRGAKLTPLEAAIFRAVVARPGLNRDDLAAAVYRNRSDGGPMWASNSISVTVCSGLNPKLRAFGVRVAAGKGSRSGYFLQVAA